MYHSMPQERVQCTRDLPGYSWTAAHARGSEWWTYASPRDERSGALKQVLRRRPNSHVSLFPNLVSGHASTVAQWVLKLTSRLSTLPTTRMAFLGLRKWPTPVRRPENASSVCTDKSALFPSVLRGDYFQVMKPLWPFIAASGITFYLVSKVQDAAVRCTFLAYKLAARSPQPCARNIIILMPRL